MGRPPARPARVRRPVRDEVVGDPPQQADARPTLAAGDVRVPRLDPPVAGREQALRPVRGRDRDRPGRRRDQPAGRLVPAGEDAWRSRSTTPRSSSSACGSSVPAATTTRSSAGARTTTTASPRSSAGSAASRASTRSRPGSSSCRPAWPTDPTTGRDLPPALLGGAESALDLGPDHDPRQALVDWLRRPDNPFFARALVNRYWKHFFGRGLVEPEDDMRVEQPADESRAARRPGRRLRRARLRPEAPGPDDRDQPGLRPVEPARTRGTRRDRQELRPVLAAAASRPRSCSTRSARSPARARRSPACPARFRAAQLPDEGFASPAVPRRLRPPRSARASASASGRPRPTSRRASTCSTRRRSSASSPARGGRAARLGGRPAARRREGRRALPARSVARADRRGTRGLPRPPGPPSRRREAPPGVRRPDLDVDQHQGIPVQSLTWNVRESRTMLDIFGGRYRTCDGAEPAEIPAGRGARPGRADAARPAPAAGASAAARGEPAEGDGRHPGLPRRRAVAHRHVRPQARRAPASSAASSGRSRRACPASSSASCCRARRR